MKICLAVIIYFLINSNSLNAHELWLEANQYKLKSGEKLIANIKVGQNLAGESYPFLSQETERLFLVSKKGLKKLKNITRKRRKNAKKLDAGLKNIKDIQIPDREIENYEVFHLYCFRAKKRDKLIKFLHSKKIDAKKHYPIPMHLQLPSKKMGNYKKGDFPFSEKLCDETISLPVHEFIKEKDLKFMIKNIKNFYSKNINS